MRLKVLAAVAVFTAAAAFGMRGDWPWPRLEATTDAPTGPAGERAATATSVDTAIAESFDTLRRGETLSDLLSRNGVRSFELGDIGESLDVRRLRAGLVFNVRRFVTDSEPMHISVRTGPKQRVLLRRVADSWNAESETIRWTPEIIRVDGDIANSLYEALDAQVSDDLLQGPERVRLAWDLADIYAWQVDFTRDIQAGDRFQVVLERLISDEGDVRFGRVIATDLRVSGRRLTAFRFEGANGESRFYDANGNSLRRAFLRAPVEFRRISSNFARARVHPVLGIRRRHEGTDYAAATGTPVMVAGDGVVRRAGRAGGYGNLVEVQHRNGITTRYGHLRGFARGIRAGRRVGQADVIGYVGATGLASGPHLHYEFRVNGVAQDSRRVKAGNGAPIGKGERAAFEIARKQQQALLYQTETGPQVAQRAD